MSTKKTITVSQKLKTIAPRLKRGDFANLSRRTGFHATHVRRVLIGESNPNMSIINEAFKTVGRRKTLAKAKAKA